MTPNRFRAVPCASAPGRWAGAVVQCPSPRLVQLSPNDFQRLSRLSAQAITEHSTALKPGSSFRTPNRRKTSQPANALSFLTLRKPTEVTCLSIELLRGFPSHPRKRLFWSAARLNEGSTGGTDATSQVKRLMRRVPYPVAIVTATDVGAVPKGGAHAWRGATVSSFNTVTLEPTPIVSFNIKQVSSTLDAIRSSGKFRAHLLTDSRQAAELAERFTKGNASAPFKDLNVQQNGQESQTSELCEPPLLGAAVAVRDTAPVSFTFLCHFLEDKAVEIGDHVVVFGKVEDVGPGSFDTPQNPDMVDTSCLVYGNGDYRRVHDIQPRDDDAATLSMARIAPLSSLMPNVAPLGKWADLIYACNPWRRQKQLKGALILHNPMLHAQTLISEVLREVVLATRCASRSFECVVRTRSASRILAGLNSINKCPPLGRLTAPLFNSQRALVLSTPLTKIHIEYQKRHSITTNAFSRTEEPLGQESSSVQVRLDERNDLTQAPANRISRIRRQDYRRFIQKVTLMDHHHLSALNFSMIFLQNLPKSSVDLFSAFREHMRTVYNTIRLVQKLAVLHGTVRHSAQSSLSPFAISFREIYAYIKIFLNPSHLRPERFPNLPAVTVIEDKLAEYRGGWFETECLVDSNLSALWRYHTPYDPTPPLPLSSFADLQRVPRGSLEDSLLYLESYWKLHMNRRELNPQVFTILSPRRGVEIIPLRESTMEKLYHYQTLLVGIHRFMKANSSESRYASMTAPTAQLLAFRKFLASQKKEVWMLGSLKAGGNYRARIRDFRVASLNGLVNQHYPCLPEQLRYPVFRYASDCTQTWQVIRRVCQLQSLFKSDHTRQRQEAARGVYEPVSKSDNAPGAERREATYVFRRVWSDAAAPMTRIRPNGFSLDLGKSPNDHNPRRSGARTQASPQ